MSKNYSWKITSLDTTPAGYVITAHYRVVGTDGAVSAELAGCIGFADKSDAPFKPYAALSEAEIVAWVKAQVGDERVASIEADLAEQINDRASPPVVNTPLPWGAGN